MTFLEEIIQLSAEARRKKKQKDLQDAAEYQKMVDNLSDIIDAEMIRCRNHIRHEGAEGIMPVILKFTMKDRPDIVAQQVAKKLREEGFRVSSPHFNSNLFRGYYTVEVSWVW